MLKKKFTILALSAFLAVALAGPAMAADKASKTLSHQDKEFIKEAAQDGLMEVQLGNIVAQRATNSDVKQFGQMIANDHAKANEQLKQIAAREGIQLPQQLDEDHKEKIDKLNKSTGPDFDKKYMSHMVDDHKNDIDKFKEQAEDGKDPALKSFASKSLPTLEHHLAMAKQIEEKIKSQE